MDTYQVAELDRGRILRCLACFDVHWNVRCNEAWKECVMADVDEESSNQKMEDNYPTCKRSYVTLRIYPANLDPKEVTHRLGIEPSEWQRQGETRYPNSKRSDQITLNGWFLTSNGIVNSKDSRQHLDWLLAQLAPKADTIRALQAEGCRMDISCYWLSKCGHGGPSVTPNQMEQLARLGVELWFDVYFEGE